MKFRINICCGLKPCLVLEKEKIKKQKNSPLAVHLAWRRGRVTLAWLQSSGKK